MEYTKYDESGAYVDGPDICTYYKSDADKMLANGTLTQEEYDSLEIIEDL